ncbi:MAG TPA: phosphonate ABC transporter ATP-binding protein [Caulobacteraceae bacterium]|nr:phosphonate ABC transporter ATP-binding protein [Caulobacteraceae bacterium]
MGSTSATAPIPAAFVHAASKAYGKRLALDQVSFEVAPGEMVGLIGPSGSGKSTLLRAISGLVVLDRRESRIEAFGLTVQKNGRVSGQVRKARASLGFIFQQFNLVGRLSLFTNVMLGGLGRYGRFAGVLGRWPAAEKAKAMAALQRVGVADFAGQRASQLSGGQQQRGAIARAIVQGAKAVLADEPIASLDPVSARRVMDLLVELNQQDGVAVIVTLHQVDYALRYCDRILALQGGKLVYDGPATGLKHDKLVEIYGPEIEDAFWEGSIR